MLPWNCLPCFLETAKREEYDLKPYFYTALNTVDSIQYRHEIIQDIEKQDILDRLKAFSKDMSSVRVHLAQADKLYYSRQKERWMLDAMSIYFNTIQKLSEDLLAADLKSRGLLAFRDFLKEHIESDQFSSFQSEARRLTDALNAIRYCMLVNGSSIRISMYENEVDYTAEVETTFERFKQGSVKNYATLFPEYADMNHVEAGILNVVARLYSDTFSDLSTYCSNLSRYIVETVSVFEHEIQFYIACLDYIAKFRYILHRFQEGKRIWWKQLWQAIRKRFSIRKQPENIVRISERDESGARALMELRNRGMNLVADALARSADHILGFLDTLRMETAFYVGCLNLHDHLVEIEEPVCFPMPLSAERRKLQCIELYDVCLSLTMRRKVVGNDLDLEGKDLVIITGANQGGKSTFLRSIGLSRLMMQCGMFVGARYFCSDVCTGVFTHYKREEDAAMNSGKLDEELSRMSDIADNIRPNSVLLFNESFAATNEREGAEIARQITCALMEKRVKVFFVTHQYEFARIFHEKQMDNVVFLRADRRQDGSRSFRLMKNPPLETSFGEDLYHSVFMGSLSGKKAGNATCDGLHP